MVVLFNCKNEEDPIKDEDARVLTTPLTKLMPEPVKVHRRPYDGLRCSLEWRDVFTNRAECENFCHRVSSCVNFRDSVTPSLAIIWSPVDFLRLRQQLR